MQRTTYRVNEIFCSPQGEGYRQGQPSVFVRFAGCNLRCMVEPGRRSPGGFDCDTEFVSHTQMTIDQIRENVMAAWMASMGRRDPEYAYPVPWIVFTGGEPMLQLDQALCDAMHAFGWKLQIETNGTREVPASFDIDWITVSPKVAEHAIKQLTADEVKYVRGHGQALPRTRVKAGHYFISPAFIGLDVDLRASEWCQQLIEEHRAEGFSRWQISMQMHKIRGER